MSVFPALLQETASPEHQRVFNEVARQGTDAIIVNDRGDLFSRKFDRELAAKSRLPAIYSYREFVQAGGSMAYGADLGELGARMADDVHEVLNGAKQAISRFIGRPDTNSSLI